MNPAHAAMFLTPTDVEMMVATVLPLMEHVDVEKLKQELPTYLAVAKEVDIDTSTASIFSDQVLAFWRSTPKDNMQEWRKAAYIIFSMSPNSAACERVFSLLKTMYGSQQDSVLADHLQASLMLRYNGRNALD